MKLVGLTGGIATGKSTFAAELRQAGITVIDADEVAKLVTKKGEWGYRRVVAAFGPRVLGQDGELDRQRLGGLVFNDPAARSKLNHATHLPILLRLIKLLVTDFFKFKTEVVLDMPLLFETGFYRITRPRILVAATPGLQEARLMSRDQLPLEDARARIGSQMSVDAKRRMADIVVENEGSREELAQAARTVAEVVKRHRWLHIYVFSPLGVALTITVLAVLR
ncbi:hypothetical protein QBZ16_004831 [Prototheca wickerhamii]|uniref:Dephospho-CoA kinase n=1 Tax=Prototheca wickerhamii TaxID=3111 RepID=A0AAD9IJ94_PROWI|nr:hypothetical protein QBZ16_004831 [Prototheca wickerhamii]